MTKPTGKTNPPRTFTIPGFDAVRPVAPPCNTSESKPPNESIAPAINYAITCQAACLLTYGLTHGLDEGGFISVSVFLNTLQHHYLGDLFWLQRTGSLDSHGAGM